jgi:hypothetical protein
LAPPGRMYNYTNPGFMLAGLIIESVSDTYYRHYLRENVFEPLGMTRTLFLPEQVLTDGNFAYGSTPHWETGEPFVVAPNSYDNGWARPAGLAFSSVLDLAKFIMFLRTAQPEILSQERHAAMLSPQANTEMFLDQLHYGFGFFIQEGGFYNPGTADFYQLRILLHGGDIPGFSADLYYVPECDFGFIALTNASYTHLSASFVAALNELCDLPMPSPIPDDMFMTPPDYTRYAGHYTDDDDAGDLWVARKSDQLLVDIPVFENLGYTYQQALQPVVRANFNLLIHDMAGFDVYPLPVTFIMDGNDQPEYLRTRGFVAEYTDKATTRPGSGPGTRSLSHVSSPSPQNIHVQPFLPEPQFPLMKPQGGFGEMHIK